MEEPAEVTADRIIKDLLMPPHRNSNKTEFNLNAGGAGAWIAATCCIVMLLVFASAGAIAAIWMSREFTRIDVEFSKNNDRNDVQDAYINKFRSQQNNQEKKP